MILNSIFNDYHKISLESLKKIGKRPAKQALEKIDGINRYMVEYCSLTALGGHAIPLTDRMINYLRNYELVNPDADDPQIGGFLAKQISAKNAYEFYALLRRESKARRGRKKKKTKTKTKTKKRKRKN